MHKCVYSIYYGNEFASSSTSDVDNYTYIIIVKLLDLISNMLPVFTIRWEIKICCRGFSFVRLSNRSCNVAWIVKWINFTTKLKKAVDINIAVSLTKKDSYR